MDSKAESWVNIHGPIAMAILDTADSDIHGNHIARWIESGYRLVMVICQKYVLMFWDLTPSSRSS